MRTRPHLHPEYARKLHSVVVPAGLPKGADITLGQGGPDAQLVHGGQQAGQGLAGQGGACPRQLEAGPREVSSHYSEGHRLKFYRLFLGFPT